MGMYRDSQLGLCIDVRGPDGNVFFLMGYARNLANQIGGDKPKEVSDSWDALRAIDASYPAFLHMFEEHFPMVTLIGKEEVLEAHTHPETEGD